VRSTVTVTGTNLTGATHVALHGVGAAFSVLSATTLTFTVPVGATTGAITVTTPGGTATSGSFTVTAQPPTITSFTPLSGPVGTPVTVTGSNLDQTVGVQVGSVLTVPTSATGTQVVFAIPPGAATGHIRLLTRNGSATSTGTLTVTP
jgi:large repetitive protein